MTSSLINSEHKFECVRLELEIVPLTQADRVDLVLSIFFGEHEEDLHFGSAKAKFAIKKGFLNLKLHGGSISLGDFKLKDDFQTVVEIEVSEEMGSEKQGGLQVGFTNSSLSGSMKDGEKSSVKQVVKEYQATIASTKPDAPRWLFEAKVDECLKGLLQNCDLATMKLQSTPCHIIGSFEISGLEDVVLLNGEFFVSKNITEKSHMAIIQRAIIKNYLKKVLSQKPYFSRVELQHG